ncbi:MAG TPA: hypothetical protein VLB67_13690 [Acidimicrobiia bacterium]|nr:hypothetical protein [Acidimicrobiia bacterium]
MTERGTAAVELALGVLVLLVPMAMLVLSFGPSLEARVLARSLAADLASTLVVFGGTVPPAHLDRLVDQARGAGVDPVAIRVDPCGEGQRPLTFALSCPLVRGGVVEVSVTLSVHRPVVGGPSSISATSRLRVPDHRSSP